MHHSTKPSPAPFFFFFFPLNPLCALRAVNAQGLAGPSSGLLPTCLSIFSLCPSAPPIDILETQVECVLRFIFSKQGPALSLIHNISHRLQSFTQTTLPLPPASTKPT